MTNPGTTTITQQGGTLSFPDRKLVNVGAQLTPTIQHLYSIFLWDLGINEVYTANLDPAKRTTKAEYFFNVPPKVYDIGEPFTTKVVATQNGGKFIESQGSIFKDIRLQGTTGLRPRKKAPTNIPLLSTSSFQTLLGGGFTEGIRTIPTDEYTGFDDIHFLRNIFRKYSDLKLTSKRVIMVWRNIKDDDYWIVEPKDFKLTQNSASPLTYQYSISLQGLAKFNSSLARPEEQDHQNSLRDIQRFISRIQEYNQALTSSFLVISTQITRIQGAGFFAIDTILSPLTAVVRGLASIASASNAVRRNLARAATEGKTNVELAITQLSDSLEPATGAAVTRRDPVLRELRRSVLVFERILTEPTLADSVSTSVGETRSRATGAYTVPGGPAGAPTSPAVAGSPTFIGSSSTPTSIAEDHVHFGEDLRACCARLLGDARRWHELALLNDLRAPYISDSGTATEGVLQPGDAILYPSTQSTTDVLAVNLTNMSPDETEQQDANVEGIVSQIYGRDLRLKSVPAGNDLDVTDIVVNQRGDVATIVGIPNVKQAIRLKFSTEQGDLPSHPSFGSKFPIGSKADVASFNTFRLNAIATFLSDGRIKEITSIQFVAVGDILTIDARVLLTDGRQFLSTNFALRRF